MARYAHRQKGLNKTNLTSTLASRQAVATNLLPSLTISYNSLTIHSTINLLQSYNSRWPSIYEREITPPLPPVRAHSRACGIVVAQALQRVVEGVVARVAGQTPKAAALGERELKAAALFPAAERSRRARQGQCRVQSYVGAAQGKAGARGGSGRPAFGSEHIGQPRDAQQQEVASAVRHALRRRCTLWACRRMIHARVSLWWCQSGRRGQGHWPRPGRERTPPARLRQRCCARLQSHQLL